jgi:S-adenosylmethionine hydrolase
MNAGGSLYDSNYNDIPKIYPMSEHYIAQLKGLLMQISPDIAVVDITHSIKMFDQTQTAFVLRSTYPFFPKGTIHLVGVNSEPSPENRIVLVEKDGHYFVGANDGMFGMVFDRMPDSAVELLPATSTGGFAALGLFVGVVRRLTDRVALSEIGNKIALNQTRLLEAGYGNNLISGTVVLVDHFGNLITNISKDLFLQIGKNRPFAIKVQNVCIKEISEHYDVKCESLALFNSANMLEIAMPRMNLSFSYSINTGDNVRIDFADDRLFF